MAINLRCVPRSARRKVQQALKNVLERELKLKLSPEKTRIVHANETGVEFLGFHFNGRWKKPRDKAVKKFKSEVLESI
ncbi:MAG: hypothetical protein WA144_05140 [Candidatus Methanoperedens sp.]